MFKLPILMRSFFLRFVSREWPWRVEECEFGQESSEALLLILPVNLLAGSALRRLEEANLCAETEKEVR